MPFQGRGRTRAVSQIAHLAVLILLTPTFAGAQQCDDLCVDECECSDGILHGRLLDLRTCWEEELGIATSALWTMDTSYLMSGGLRPGDWAHRNLFDVGATWDLEQQLGGTVNLLFQAYVGEDGSQATGDEFVYSNIDNPFNYAQISELFYERTFADDRVRFKFGKFDANSEFNFSEVAGDFINSGKGNHPTTFTLMPTYPAQASGLAIFLQPDDPWFAGFALFDGRLVDGEVTGQQGLHLGGPYWLVGEVGFRVGERSFTRATAGVWHNTSNRIPLLNGVGTQEGETGVYFNLDRTLWLENPDDEEDDQGIYLAASYGVGDGSVNPLPEGFTAGLVWKGLVACRDEDSAGVAVIWARASRSRLDVDENSDTHIEMYYRSRASDQLVVQPVITHMANPGTNSTTPAAWVASLRLLYEL